MEFLCQLKYLLTKVIIIDQFLKTLHPMLVLKYFLLEEGGCFRFMYVALLLMPKVELLYGINYIFCGGGHMVMDGAPDYVW